MTFLKLCGIFFTLIIIIVLYKLGVTERHERKLGVWPFICLCAIAGFLAAMLCDIALAHTLLLDVTESSLTPSQDEIMTSTFEDRDSGCRYGVVWECSSRGCVRRCLRSPFP